MGNCVGAGKLFVCVFLDVVQGVIGIAYVPTDAVRVVTFVITEVRIAAS
jgi:hypothetical protein